VASPDASESSDGGTDATLGDASPDARADAANEDGGADATTDGDTDDAGSDASTTSDTGSDASNGSDASLGSDAATADAATDAGFDAGPPGPCQANPVLVAKGASGPTRTWCQSFAYPTPAGRALVPWVVQLNVALRSGGGANVFGLIGDSTTSETITVGGTTLTNGAPFTIAVDGSGGVLKAQSLASGTFVDGGVEAPYIVSGAQGTLGDFALGGITGSDMNASPAVLWTYSAAGAPEGSKVFVPSAPFAEAQIQSLVPVDGGDFVAAGAFSTGTDFGCGPLTTSTKSDTFVARFSPAGECRWSTAIGAGNSGPNAPFGATVDAHGHVSVAAQTTEGDGGQKAYVARLDVATGAKQWVADLYAGSMSGLSVAPDGDDLVVAVTESIAGPQVFGVSGADGHVRYTGPVLGQLDYASSAVTSMASDGAGGAILTGLTLGGPFGSIDVPRTSSPACYIARTDAAGNPTWFTLCSGLGFSAGADVVVSGKRVALVGTIGVLMPNQEPLCGCGTTNGCTCEVPNGTPPFVVAEEYEMP
jgi:hypothetical protein